MKNYLLTKSFWGFFSLLLIAVILLSTSDILYNTVIVNEINYKQPITKIKKLKKDRPDLFAKYMNDIRKGFGEDNPGYPANYRIKELLKATNLNSTAGLNKLAKSNVVNWTERGPGNVSGRTRSIVVDPDDATFNTWFVGNVSGGVWKTTDAGASWTHLTAALPTLATSVLVMSESNHNIMYMGTGEGFGNLDQIHGSGIWKSTDRGVTWNQLSSTANSNFQNITRLIIDPNDPNIVIVSTSAGFQGLLVSSGIWKTIDGGVNWTQKYSTYSTVEDLIANPGNFNSQYATVNGSGIIKSLNGGNSWISSSSGIPLSARIEIAVASTDTSKIYASVVISSFGNGPAKLYVSDDAGTTWNPSVDLGGDKDWLGGQGWYNNAIAVDPYDATTVYVAGVNIMKLTVTGTSNSAPQISGVNEINTSSFWEFANIGLPFANGGLDTGENFTGLNTNTTTSDFSTVEIRFGSGITQKAHRFLPSPTSPLFSNFVYQDYVDVPFQVWDTDNNKQLMASFHDQDNDGTWNLKDYMNSTSSEEYTFVNAIDYDSTTPGANIAVTAGMAYKSIYAMLARLPLGGTFDPNNLPTSKIVINWGTIPQKNITTTVITDAYADFSGPNPDSLVHPDHHNLTIVKTNPATQSFRLLDGNDGGVTYSDDKGTSFIKTLNGYNTTQFYGLDKMPNNNKYIGGTQDNGSWLSPLNPTATSQWTSAPSGDGFEAAWNYRDANQLLESSQFNFINKSTNGGASWVELSGFSMGSQDAPFLTRIASSKLAPDRVFVVGKTAIFRSENFGDTWTEIQMSSQPGWDGTNSATQIRFSLADPSIIWAGWALSSFLSSPFYVSTDSGHTFSQTQIPSIAPDASISGLATHPTDANTAYVLFSNANKAKIIMTTDLGQTWSELSGFGSNTTSSNGFPDVGVFSLLVMPTNTNIIWAGTEIGIFESRDAGATWHYSSNGFPAVAIWQMRAFDNQVIIATHGRGIWTAPLADIVTGVETNTSVIPEDYSLSQNYPNPFNPSTTINFTLPVKSNVNLIIYDALGRKVNEIVNEELPAGLQKVNWNGLNSSGVRTSSGVYFYRLIAKGENGNQFVQTKKMILMK